MMSSSARGRLSATLLLLAALWSVPPACATIVRFDTSAGNIDVRLYDQATPYSVANFLNYANTNRYDGSFIHRAADSSGTNFVVQGGGFLLNNSIFDAAPIAHDAPVQNEPGISNLRGTLAYAKGSDPNSATSQWFFNMKNNSFLDLPANGAFTVFGRVVAGSMTVVDAIANLPLINASVAQNQPGEDYDEIPVFNVNKVLSQGDIFNDDAVIINSIDVLPLSDADYNFNGVVDEADFDAWKSSFGSTIDAGADGNGDGIVNVLDYIVWRNSMPSAQIPGDYDGNGQVEEADFVKWRLDFGATVAPGTGADGNGDGIVNVLDYIWWRNHLPPTGSGSAAIGPVSVPEPGAATLLVITALVLAGRRRHR